MVVAHQVQHRVAGEIGGLPRGGVAVLLRLLPCAGDVQNDVAKVRLDPLHALLDPRHVGEHAGVAHNAVLDAMDAAEADRAGDAVIVALNQDLHEVLAFCAKPART